MNKDSLEPKILISDDGTFKCPRCGNHNAYIITRVTGYFSKTSMWNQGKIQELRKRHREKFTISKK